ncbi:MAG: hypothetical protein ACLUR5_14060 [Eubacterium ventriosum]
MYFTLKDRTGVISAIMFAGNRSGLKFKMEERTEGCCSWRRKCL